MRFRKSLTAAMLVSVIAAGPALAQSGKAGGKDSKHATSSSSASALPAAQAPGGSPPSSSVAGGSSQPAAPSSATAPAGGGYAVGAAASAGGPAGGSMDGQTYAVRLRDLEQRVDELKEQIRRSHTRLSLLSDTVLSGGVAGSRAEIQFQNEMSNAFRMTRALFVLDGAVQYNKADDTGALSEQAIIPIFSGSIPPGDHTLQVLVQLQGNGENVFTYLKGYKFEVRSTHSFTAVDGKTLSLQVITYEKGGVTTPLEERPAIRYFEKASSGVQGPTSAAPAQQQPTSRTGGGGPATISTGFSVGTGGK